MPTQDHVCIPIVDKSDAVGIGGGGTGGGPCNGGAGDCPIPETGSGSCRPGAVGALPMPGPNVGLPPSSAPRGPTSGPQICEAIVSVDPVVD